MRSKGLIGSFRGMFGKRDLAQLLVLVIITTIVMSLFALAFEKGPTQDIPVDIVNMDATAPGPSVSTTMIGLLGSGSTVRIENMWDHATADALQRSMDDLGSGKVRAVIFFGPNFTMAMAAWAAQNGSGVPAELTLYLDSSNPVASAAVQADVQRAAQMVAMSIFHASLPVRVVPTTMYGEGTDMRDFMAPAIAGLLIFILTLMPVMMVNGNGERIGTAGRAVASKTLISLATGLALGITVLGVTWAFGIRMEGNLWAAITVLTLLAFASASLGQVLAVLLRGRGAINLVIFPFLLCPAILLGGMVIPVSAIPSYLLPVSYAYPLTYAIEGTRTVLLGGFGWGGCWLEIMALASYGMICTIAAWVLERRKGTGV